MRFADDGLPAIAWQRPVPYHAGMAQPLTDDQAIWLLRARAGDRLALSRLVTALERGDARARSIVALLAPHLGRALVVGFTGPPGAGKSTLVDAYVSHLVREGRAVGIIAVDPSSPVSGGAILGDRLRMSASTSGTGVFMRSLSSGGSLGGLSPAAVRIIDALDGAGKDIIVLETVGTGQSEIDIADIADVRVVLAAPGLGDGVQAMKSGLLEIADILVVNQADRPGAAETHQQLLAALSLRSDRSRTCPVLDTVATRGDGVTALAAEIARQGLERMAVPAVERRRRRAHCLVARTAAEVVSDALKRGGTDLDALSDSVLAGDTTPLDAAMRLIARARDA